MHTQLQTLYFTYQTPDYIWSEFPEKHEGAAIFRPPTIWTSLMCIRVYFILEYVLIIQCHLYPWQYPVYTTVHTLANDSWINWIRMRNAVRLYLYAYMYTHYTESTEYRAHIIRWGFNGGGGGGKIKWHVDDLILTWRENELTENVNGHRTNECVRVCVYAIVPSIWLRSQCHKMKSIIQCKYGV